MKKRESTYVNFLLNSFTITRWLSTFFLNI